MPGIVNKGSCQLRDKNWYIYLGIANKDASYALGHNRSHYMPLDCITFRYIVCVSYTTFDIGTIVDIGFESSTPI